MVFSKLKSFLGSSYHPNQPSLELTIDNVTDTESKGFEVLRHLAGELSNGEVLFQQFKIKLPATEDRSLLSLVSEHLLDLMRHPDICANIPDIKETISSANQIQLSRLTPFQFVGKFAHVLHYGGAYSSWPVCSGPQALTNAATFLSSLYGEADYSSPSIQIYQMDTKWSEWFCGMSWDHAWCFTDADKGKMSLLFMTDTD